MSNKMRHHFVIWRAHNRVIRRFEPTMSLAQATDLKTLLAIMRNPRTVSIAVGLALLAADATWLAGHYVPKAAVTANTTAHQPEIGQFAMKALFGAAPAAAAPVDELASSQTIRLTGTLAFADDETQGFAIVAVSGHTQLIAVGTPIAGGRLHGIYADRIVIDQGGRLLAIHLPVGKFGGGVLEGGAFGNDDPSGDQAASSVRDPTGEELKARVDHHLAPLATVLRAEPLLNDDQYRGLVVNPNGNTYAFEHLGLKSGDSIMGVNGIPLTQENLTLFADEMRSGRPVKVSLMRPGVGMVEVSLNTTGIYVGPKG